MIHVTIVAKQHVTIVAVKELMVFRGELRFMFYRGNGSPGHVTIVAVYGISGGAEVYVFSGGADFIFLFIF